MRKNPPRLAIRFLRSFCSENRIEELEGDLNEIYQEKAITHPKILANWHFWWLVIRSFRLYALKNSKSNMVNNLHSLLYMFKHHMIVAARQSWKNKSTTLINVLGLAIGISAFVSITSIILHEYSYNQHIPNLDKVYRVYTRFSGSFSGTNRGVSAAVSGFLNENKPSQLAAISGFHTRDFNVTVQSDLKKGKFQSVQSIITDANYFEVFQQYEWIQGDQKNALSAPNQVVLSVEQAEKYFGKMPTSDYLDQRLIYNDSLSLIVKGIVRQKTGNTDFIYGDFISLKTIEHSWLKNRIDLTNWDNTNSSSQLWIRAASPLTENDRSLILDPLNKKSIELEESKDWIRSFEMAPLADMHFDQLLSIFDNRGRSAANKKTLLLMNVVSLALLFLAIINFINLEIAQAKSKMKEVGVRKVLGGHKIHLIHRFLTASLLVTTMAGLLSFPLSFYGGLLFQDYLNETVWNIMKDMNFVWVIGLTILAVTIISGLYPAIIVSKFSPQNAFAARALRSTSHRGSSYLRNAFVAFQFVCSQLLIIGSIIIYMQLDFMRNKDVGFETDNIMYIHNPWNADEKYHELLFTKLQELPELEEIVNQQSPPASNSYSSTIVSYEVGDNIIKTDVYKKWGNLDYLDFYGIDLIAGRNVEPTSNLNEIIINDTYRKELGLSNANDAIGQKVKMSDEDYTIVGVMSDFHITTLADKIDPLLFQYSDTKYGIAGKFNPANLNKMIEKVTAAYQEVYPNRSLEIQFQDQTLLEFYENEEQMSRLTGFATIIAILISGMGLFGMISLTIAHRTKEIGIRKVLGASAINIARIVSREFVRLILLSILIGIPFVSYFGSEWLSNYAYAIELKWWVYASGGLLSLIIALIVTSSKILQATNTNPVESLRYE
jgi:putative ABC transport system permease protein